MRLSSRLAISLASILFATTPALANPSGFISGNVGAATLRLEAPLLQPVITTDPAFHIRSSATHALTPVLNVQGDVEFEYKKFTLSGEDGSFDLEFMDFAGTAHLFYREPERFLAGGLMQIDKGRSNAYNDGELLGTTDYVRGVIGVEGQLFLDDVTLYGQAGFVGETYTNDEFNGTQGGLFATAQLRYFLTPDLKVDVHGLISRISSESYVNIASVGIGAEYRLPDSPISLSSTLDFYSFSNQVETITDTRVMVGVKFNFGSDSLQDQDRNGTSLDPYPTLIFAQTGGAS